MSDKCPWCGAANQDFGVFACGSRNQATFADSVRRTPKCYETEIEAKAARIAALEAERDANAAAAQIHHESAVTAGRRYLRVVALLRKMIAERWGLRREKAALMHANSSLREELSRLLPADDDANRLAYLETPRPLDEWHEDHGSVIWWRLPVEEAPFCGTPLDDDWIEDYYTHWTPLPPSLTWVGGWENKQLQRELADYVLDVESTP